MKSPTKNDSGSGLLMIPLPAINNRFSTKRSSTRNFDVMISPSLPQQNLKKLLKKKEEGDDEFEEMSESQQSEVSQL
jgi:hypothetical protein